MISVPWSQTRCGSPLPRPPALLGAGKCRPGRTRRSSRSTSSRAQPAKQVTRIPRSPWRIERLGSLSAWAGHRHMATLPLHVPPRAPTRSMSSWDGLRAVSGMISSLLTVLFPLSFSLGSDAGRKSPVNPSQCSVPGTSSEARARARTIL